MNSEAIASKNCSTTFHQIAAYQGAYEYLYGLEIPQGLIVVIAPNTMQLFSLERKELEEY